MRGPGGLILAAVAGVLALSGCGTTPSAAGETARVRVAAASDLQFVLGDLEDLVEREHPGIDLSVSHASSGTLAQQIANGAPFDLFLSADVAYPEQLASAGLADPDDVFTYARGQLVLWVPDASRLDPAGGLAVLTEPTVTAVAIASPEHAPYGRAAQAALERSGLVDAVASKLVVGESAAQAAEFVRSGNADAGLVPRSLVVAEPLRDVGRWAELPADAYPAVEQGGVVLARAADPAAARAVQDLLVCEAGRALLERHGFSVPGRVPQSQDDGS